MRSKDSLDVVNMTVDCVYNLIKRADEEAKKTLRNYIENGFDINKKTLYEKTLLHLAASDGNKELIQFLVNTGAIKTIEDSNKKMPLNSYIEYLGDEDSESSEEHCREVITNLCGNDQGIINHTILNTRSPLWMAAFKGLKTLVKILVEQGANIDQEDFYERTPLLIAIHSKKPETAQYLLEHGAKIPEDQDLSAYIETLDKDIKEHLQKAQEKISAKRKIALKCPNNPYVHKDIDNNKITNYIFYDPKYSNPDDNKDASTSVTKTAGNTNWVDTESAL